jgi:phosphopantothenoylcysteine decarboxylase/phosphopantothenate--cysteine ligase
MWEHPATLGNVETLRLRGATIVEPGTGPLASKGEWGAGRLAEPAEVLAAVERVLAGAGGSAGFSPRSPDCPRVLVTAGGTREPIDSVRYVGNRSSGRMGVALAAEAARRGAEVVLIAANLSVETPEGMRVVTVQTAAELHRAAQAEFLNADVLLMTAAVADFRPARAQDTKIKKSDRAELTLALEPTTDVLRALSEDRRPEQTIVGFAAEHGEDGLASARAKLESKRLDAVVLNDISRADIGFDTDDNEVTIVTAAGEKPVPLGPKGAVAAAVLDCVEELRVQRVGRG